MKQGKTFVATLFPLPFIGQWSEGAVLWRYLADIKMFLSQDLRLREDIASLCIGGRPRPGRQAVPQDLLPLWHEASDRMVVNEGRLYDGGRFQCEDQLLDDLYQAFCDAIECDESAPFVEWVCGIGKCLDTRNRGMRSREIFTQRNLVGNRFRFPPPVILNNRMAEIHRFIRHNFRENPVVTAIVAMVALVNAHPLVDGNGRSSRILFNAILRIGIQFRIAYVPLRECFWISGCGFEIRASIAERSNDWAFLTAYIRNLFSLCFRVA